MTMGQITVIDVMNLAIVFGRSGQLVTYIERSNQKWDDNGAWDAAKGANKEWCLSAGYIAGGNNPHSLYDNEQNLFWCDNYQSRCIGNCLYIQSQGEIYYYYVHGQRYNIERHGKKGKGHQIQGKEQNLKGDAAGAGDTFYWKDGDRVMCGHDGCCLEWDAGTADFHTYNDGTVHHGREAKADCGRGGKDRVEFIPYQQPLHQQGQFQQGPYQQSPYQQGQFQHGQYQQGQYHQGQYHQGPHQQGQYHQGQYQQGPYHKGMYQQQGPYHQQGTYQQRQFQQGPSYYYDYSHQDYDDEIENEYDEMVDENDEYSSSFPILESIFYIVTTYGVFCILFLCFIGLIGFIVRFVVKYAHPIAVNEEYVEKEEHV